MPYIKQEERKQYQKIISKLATMIPKDHNLRAGHFNYIVSLLLEKTYGKNIRYADHNEVIGVLNCIMLEFYRRKTAPYEDIKMKSEGDLT